MIKSHPLETKQLSIVLWYRRFHRSIVEEDVIVEENLILALRYQMTYVGIFRPWPCLARRRSGWKLVGTFPRRMLLLRVRSEREREREETMR